jgi:hypothetical protein
MPPARTPCICIDTVELIIRHVPLLLHLLAIALVFAGVGCFLGSVFIVLLECSITRQIADYLRGEKSKQKNDEL